MDWLSILGITLAVLLIAGGFIGSVIPAIPATPIIFIGMLIYGAVDKFEHLTGSTLLALLLIMAVAWIFEQVAGAYGAKRFGSSGWGIAGAFVGSIVAIFMGGLLGPFGFVIFPFFFAAIFEFVAGSTVKNSMRAGLGSALGVLGGIMMQVLAAGIMLFIFLRVVL